MSGTAAHIWQSTEKFRWNTGDVLGRGATAVVYKARNTTNGEVCAVKMFHDRVSQHYSAVPIRELELLQRLKHRNVIGIYDIERETSSKNYVLAMEYCDGGSLYSMLDQPKYFYGLPEEEFLIVLHDIASGTKYLRQQDIIHRDIKPGNIMRLIDENGRDPVILLQEAVDRNGVKEPKMQFDQVSDMAHGPLVFSICRSIYKLTDFGAARRLEEEETFTSIYGTEEYLDPNMYERAVLRRQKGQDFGAVVDLWSLGVTIFHTATGHLPFQPYGGRKNTETMYMITTQKESGVISGIQRTENGQIEWKRDLPRTCLLSPFLKSIVTPLIAGLLESNTRLRWTFEQFFDTVQAIKEMITIKLFNCCTGLNNKMYIRSSDRFAKCQELIAKETEIPASEQLILYHNREISEMIDLTAEIQNWPKVILRGQLYLYQRERLDQQRLSLPEIPPIPQFYNTTPISYDRDAYIAHKTSAIAHLTVRYISMSIQQQELMHLAEICLRDYIMRLTSHINNCIPDMCKLLEEHGKRQTMFYGTYTSFVKYLDVVAPLLKANPDMFSIIHDKQGRMSSILSDNNPREVLKKAENRSEECKVYMEVLMTKISEQEKEAISNCVGCLEEDNCTQKAEYLCNKIGDISSAFSKDKKQKSLPPELEYIHEADRMKIQDLCVQVVSLLQGHCLLNLARTYNVAGKQIGLLLKNVQRTKKVEQNIASVNECREKLSNRIDKMDRECLSLTEQAKEGLRTQIKGAFSLPVQLINSEQPMVGKMLLPRETGSTPPSDKLKDSALGTSMSASMLTSSSGHSSSLSDRLSSKFQTLDVESVELQKSLDRNIKSIQENNTMLEHYGIMESTQETASPIAVEGAGLDDGR